MQVDDFISIMEVDDGPRHAQAIFDRRYRLQVPEFPNHIVAFYRRDDGSLVPVCYVHFTDCGDIMLCGGACTDDRVLRQMSTAQRDRLREVGGVFRLTLNWCTRRYASRCLAMFGYSGDALAHREGVAAGWVPLEDHRLLAFWCRELDERKRHELIAKAQSFIPF
mgnify:CR=1 FL=1